MNLAALIRPVPPLEQLGVVLIFRGEIDGATKHVQDTTINVHAMYQAQAFVHHLRILPLQVRQLEYAQIPQIPCHAGPDSRDDLQLVSHWLSPV